MHSKNKTSKINIGTSGWLYKHWQNLFYPEKLPKIQWLEYYAKFFNCLELNASFYRAIKPETYQNWYKRTPPTFGFIIKAPKIITHIKRLKNIEESLNQFFSSAENLQNKLKGILWQLPPSLPKDTNLLNSFLNKTTKINKKIIQIIEFRHNSWFNNQTYNLMEKYNLTFCIADNPKIKTPKIITNDYVYIRFHGNQNIYSSEYTVEQLTKWADYCLNCLNKRKIVFCFFNNDYNCFAVKNALQLKEILNNKLK